MKETKKFDSVVKQIQLRTSNLMQSIDYTLSFPPPCSYFTVELTVLSQTIYFIWYQLVLRVLSRTNFIKLIILLT